MKTHQSFKQSLGIRKSTCSNCIFHPFIFIAVIIFSSCFREDNLDLDPLRTSDFCPSDCINRINDAYLNENGGFVVAGHIIDTSVSGDSEFWVAKVESSGNIVWNKRYFTHLSSSASAHSVKKLIDGGYVVVGEANFGDEVLVIKLSSDGEIIWERVLGGSGKELAGDVIETTEGDIVLAGKTGSKDIEGTVFKGYFDCWITKLDQEGNVIWNYTYGGSGDDGSSQIQQTSDGGFIVGATSSTDNNGDVTGNYSGRDYWVLKLDATGLLEWQQSYGGFSDDVASAIIQSKDGGYVVLGTSESSDGEVEKEEEFSVLWVVKIDNTGAIEWKYQHEGYDYGRLGSILQTSDDNFVVSGPTRTPPDENTFHNGNILIVKLDPNGKFLWRRILGNGLTPVAVRELINGNILVGVNNSSDNVLFMDMPGLELVELDPSGKLVN